MHTACDYVWINANNDWLYRKEAVIIIFSDQQFLGHSPDIVTEDPLPTLIPPPLNFFFTTKLFFSSPPLPPYENPLQSLRYAHITLTPHKIYPFSTIIFLYTPSPLHTLLISTSSFNYALILWYDLICFKYALLQCSYLILAFDKSFHDDTVGIFITHLLLIQY